MIKSEFLGMEIVKLFELPKLRKKSKQYGKNYYQTAWGDRTIEGVGACVLNIVNEMSLKHIEKCLNNNFTPEELESQRMQEFYSQLIGERRI